MVEQRDLRFSTLVSRVVRNARASCTVSLHSIEVLFDKFSKRVLDFIVWQCVDLSPVDEAQPHRLPKRGESELGPSAHNE